MSIQKFPENYDKENCIDSCRFWLMLKMKDINDYWSTRYDLYVSELRAYLYTINKHKVVVEKEVEDIQLLAYKTISEKFFK